ncbi:MAG: hypothetical protein RIR18_1641 [Pseudomonadota bacterium]|jgi:transcriptional regulator with XRE-family HTH domain
MKIAAKNLTLSDRLSKNIQEQRKILGMTQACLAEKLGIEPESVSRFERGVNLPSLATLEKIARILETTNAGLLSEFDDVDFKLSQRLAAALHNVPSEKRHDIAKIVELICKVSQ